MRGGASAAPRYNCGQIARPRRNRNSGRRIEPSRDRPEEGAASGCRHPKRSERAVLPKFYFQVIENGVEGPLDEVGLDYRSLEAAEQDAAAVIAGMMDNAEPQGTQTIEIVISDAHRKPLARVKAALSRDRMS